MTVSTLLTAAVTTLLLTGGAYARDVQSLDGTWRIAFDGSNEGRAAAWHTREIFQTLEEVRDIQVPSCWEEIEQDYEGVAFYGTTFRVSSDWKNQTVRLQFGAVNYIAEVWLNETCVGRHEGGYGPFEFRVDDLLNFEDDNFLSLRVLGPILHEDKIIDGIGPNDMPHWRGAIAGGIWQSVQLVATGPVFVDDIFIIPQLKDDTATVQLQLENTNLNSSRQDVVLSVSNEGRVVSEQCETIRLKPGKNGVEWALAIPDTKTWSPNEPNLYTLTVKLGNSDEETVRFGMRELTIRNNRFELNGEPVTIKAAFFEGLYPNRLALPDSIEMARLEIRLAKEAGFNMIRPWRKPPPPEWLDLCDEMGVMVVGGFPIECMNNWPSVTPHLRDRIEHEVRSAIQRDRNRACIVQWEIFNEIYREDLHRFKHSTSLLARKLDPSRLILDESGGFAGGSNIYLPYQLEPEVFNDVHSYPGAPLSQAGYDGFLTLAKTEEEIQALDLKVPAISSRSVIQPGLLTYVSEIGYGSLPDLENNNKRFEQNGNPLVPAYRYHRELAQTYRAALQESGLDAVYPDLRDFCMDQQQIHGEANKRMIEAIRLNSSTCGYAVHALTDGDWVVGAGLLDLFRNPKPAVYEATRDANAERYIAVNVQPRNVYAEKGATLRLTGINDLSAVGGRLSIEVVDADGAIVFKKEQDVVLKPGIGQLDELQLDTADWSGRYTVKVQLVEPNGKETARNEFELEVFSADVLKVPEEKLAVVDSHDVLHPFLMGRGIRCSDFNPETPVTLPVLVVGSVSAKKSAKLKAFAEKGGTVVFLECGEYPLPVRGGKRGVKGLWVGVGHVVTDHPVFEGLPSDGLMDQTYENVWAMKTLTGLKTQPIVGSVTHDFYPMKRNIPNYLGPEPAWWGTDLGIIQQGEGRLILSALRLVNNLDKDPVADKILFNLIGFAARPAN
ncbi:Beta-galactosidase [Pontiella desulfatans]|uniref:Beta-galactosidase n=1 Tax=Pontiella desulfatans TaxID=2750659 RepID=A0A6C2TWE3_PONDE|nr:sugar-binding domain-containing protein [Pontiella desulfatans]VGO11990.1 Beta-galactosidase [Pontiella desulfatans]